MASYEFEVVGEVPPRAQKSSQLLPQIEKAKQHPGKFCLLVHYANVQPARQAAETLKKKYGRDFEQGWEFVTRSDYRKMGNKRQKRYGVLGCWDPSKAPSED